MAEDVMGEYDSAAKLALVTSAVGVLASIGLMSMLFLPGGFSWPWEWIQVLLVGICALTVSAIVPALERNAYVTRQLRLQSRLESDEAE